MTFMLKKAYFSQTINILGIVFVETKVNLKYLAKYKTKMHVDYWLITSHWILSRYLKYYLKCSLN